MIALACLVLGQVALKPYVLAGFKVALPAAPVPLETANVPAGGKAWTARTPGGTTVAVSYVEFRDEKGTDDVHLAQFLGGMARSSHGTLTAQKDLILDGWTGLEATLRTPKGLTWSRSYAFPGAILTVAILGSAASRSLADAVFASVLTDPKRGPGPRKEAGPVWERVATGPAYSVDYPAKPERHDLGHPTGASLVGWLATYGNRYYATYVTTLSKGAPMPEGDALAETLKITNTQNAAAVQGTIVGRKPGLVMGRPSETLEATSPDGTATMIFQTTAVADGVVMLAVVVPTCWKDSSEVARFLASVKPSEGKTPPDGGR